MKNSMLLAIETNKKLKERRVEKYNLDPILCKECQEKIPYDKAVGLKAIFCNSSCAAKFNNKKFVKRKKRNRKCSICDNPAKTKNSTYCSNCKPPKAFDMTLAEAIYVSKHKSSAYSMVRSRARNIAKKLNMNTCAICGYSKHVEICHIQAVNSFDLSTMLSVINSPNNLIPLCPTHHWEFDNNKLDERSKEKIADTSL